MNLAGTKINYRVNIVCDYKDKKSAINCSFSGKTIMAKCHYCFSSCDLQLNHSQTSALITLKYTQLFHNNNIFLICTDLMPVLCKPMYVVVSSSSFKPHDVTR